MNIHFMAGQKMPTPRGHKVSKEGTQPPKTRPGKTYPGGRSLRRSLAKLALRRKMHNDGDEAHTMPGSMAA